MELKYSSVPKVKNALNPMVIGFLAVLGISYFVFKRTDLNLFPKKQDETAE